MKAILIFIPFMILTGCDNFQSFFSSNNENCKAVDELFFIDGVHRTEMKIFLEKFDPETRKWVMALMIVNDGDGNIQQQMVDLNITFDYLAEVQNWRTECSVLKSEFNPVPGKVCIIKKLKNKIGCVV